MSDKSKKTLKGRTFLITRTVEGNKSEKEKLEKLGARVIELPLIEIRPPSNHEKIEKAVRKIGDFDWIVFTSANGVGAFFSKVNGEKRKAEIRAKFACVGSETQKALEAQGFKPSLVPSEFLTLKLGQELLSRFGMKGKRVLLARAEEANREIGRLLRNAGAIVVEAPVYSTATRKIKNLNKKILDQITDITLTSPSTVKGLVSNFTPDEIKSKNIRIHCIGPITAESVRKEHLYPNSTASVHTIDGLIDSINI
ncbi:MAG: uroporphyrinogen-III synthase [archaeon]|nr:uroporphyrinogen-III synthase [archaeon]